MSPPQDQSFHYQHFIIIIIIIIIIQKPQRKERKPNEEESKTRREKKNCFSSYKKQINKTRFLCPYVYVSTYKHIYQT